MSTTTRSDIELRPLSTLEVVDAAWNLFVRGWLRFLAILAPTTALLFALTGLYLRWLTTLVGEATDSVFLTGTVVWALLMSVAWGLHSLGRGALVAAVLTEVRGEQMAVGAAWRRALAHAGPLLFHGFFVGCLLWLGVGCLLVPMLMAASIWAVARPLILQEGSGYLPSLRESQELTEGYAGRGVMIWGVHLMLWLVLGVNLFLGLSLGLSLVGSAAGVDLTRISEMMSLSNRTYLLCLAGLAFLILDPLKTSAEAIFYLDLCVRRDGADLHQRLAGLRTRFLPVAAAALFLMVGAARPVAAMPLGEYQRKVAALRQQIERSETGTEVDPTAAGELEGQVITMPDGQKISVDNEWLAEQISDWEGEADKRAVLQRLGALEQALGPIAPTGEPAVPPSGTTTAAGAGPDAEQPLIGDPKDVVKEVLSQPRYQELAARPELRELLGEVDFTPLGSSWKRFWTWIKEHLLKLRMPEFNPPNVNAPDPGAMRAVLYTVLVVVGAVLLVMLLSSLFRRWRDDGETSAATVISDAPELEAASTENALDHTVDEWEQFAAAFLKSGNVRKAIRALYLATLVHLHRERQIDYNRTRTNWHYVRNYRGQSEGRRTLRGLTQMFDEVWYGQFPYGREEYSEFETGVRALGTPAPSGGATSG